MKKASTRFFLGFAAFAAIVLIVMGLQSAAPAPALNGCAGGTYYNTALTYPISYGKVDTFVNAGTDSFKVSVGCKPTSITFSNDVWKANSAGSVNVTVALYASCNGGSTYGGAALVTYTVNPTSLTVAATNTYIVNGPYGGNPYTNYVWVATATGAVSTMSWQGTVLVR